MKCKQCDKQLMGQQKSFCSRKCMGIAISIKKRGIYFFDRSGMKHSDQTKAKLKIKRKGKTPALGMKHTEETKNRIRESCIKTMGRNGRNLTVEGYIKINCNDREHPYKDKRGYVLEHRLVCENVIGRFLLPKERIHHINGNITDNRKENLYITSPSMHNKIHWDKRKNMNIVLISNLDTYDKT